MLGPAHLHISLQGGYLSFQAGYMLLVCRAKPGRAPQERCAAWASPGPTASPETAAGSFTGSYGLLGTVNHLLRLLPQLLCILNAKHSLLSVIIR